MKIISQPIQILFLIIVITSCKEIVEPVHDHKYDPLNPNREIVVPVFNDFEHVGQNSFRFKMIYPTNSAKGYNIERKVEEGNFELFYNSRRSITSIYEQNKDKKLTYEYRAIAYYDNYFSNYSNTIQIKYNETPNLNMNVIGTPYFKHEDNLLIYAKDKRFGAIVNDGIKIISTSTSLKIINTIEESINKNVQNFCFSEDSQNFAYTSSDSVASIYETRTWQKLFEINLINSNYKNIIIDHRNSNLICYSDHLIDIYSFTERKIINSLLTSNIIIKCITYDSKDSQLIIGTSDNRVVFRHPQELTIIKEIILSTGINSIEMDNTKNELMVSNSNKILVIEKNNLGILFEYNLQSNNQILNCFHTFHPDYYIFNTKNEIVILNKISGNEKIIHFSDEPYATLQSDDSNITFLTGGYPIKVFKLTYSEGYWESEILE